MIIHYEKRKNKELFKNFKELKSLNIESIQNYVPIYKTFFNFKDNQNINLNHTNYMTSIAENAGDLTNDNDKEHHHWGQSVSGMLDLVKRLTKPSAHIVDPFMGAGTTGVAAAANGCHFTGCDIDAKSVATAQKRLAA
jgi:DNA modification methylase